MVKKICAVMLLLMMVCGCETTLNETQSGALAGTALGAGLGAIIGNPIWHAGAGTAIGAGAGALAGGLIGEGMRRQKTQTSTVPQQYQQVQPVQQQVTQVQEIHTKYNPRTGETFPETYTYDPKDGTELQYIK